MSDKSLLTFTNKLLKSNLFSCTICNELLLAPIILVEDVGSVCSTCYEKKSMGNQWKCLVNTSLENILNEFNLPCKYYIKGCKGTVMYKYLSVHQDECKYGTKLCPLSKFGSCKWEGNLSNFLPHFQECHKDNVIKSEDDSFSVETNITEALDTKLIKVLATKTEVFLLKIKTNISENKLLFILCKIIAGKTYEYTAAHKKGNDEEIYVSTQSTVIPSIKSIYGNLDEEADVEEVNLDTLGQSEQLHNTVILSTFKIIKIKTKEDELNDKLLSLFECIICKNYLRAPIMQCPKGHRICIMCRVLKLAKCPCGGNMVSKRNSSLETLSLKVQYPCMYHNLGCPEKSPNKKILVHEHQCFFKNFNCPFENCLVTGNNFTMESHLKHSHLVFEVSEYEEVIRIDNALCGKVDTAVFIVYGHIFKLTRKRMKQHYLWTTDIIGGKFKNFGYEITISDMKRPEKKFYESESCFFQDFFEMCELAEEDKLRNSISIPNSILSYYSSKKMISVNFKIAE